MKKLLQGTLFLICALAFSNKTYAQEFPRKGITAIQNNNVSEFKNVFKPQDYNKCFSVKEDQYTPLAFAVRFEKTDIIDQQLKNNANVNTQCDGLTALFVAAKYNHTDLVKKLLKAGADKNLKNKDGKTAKDIAKERNFIETAALL